MDSDPNAQFFRKRHDLLDEIRVVLPQLFLREPAAMSERAGKDFAAPMALWVFVHVEGARQCAVARRLALAAPDAIAHVRVSRVGIPGFGEVAQIALVLLDPFVAT